jgi:hypothetical protein
MREAGNKFVKHPDIIRGVFGFSIQPIINREMPKLENAFKAEEISRAGSLR